MLFVTHQYHWENEKLPSIFIGFSVPNKVYKLVLWQFVSIYWQPYILITWYMNAWKSVPPYSPNILSIQLDQDSFYFCAIVQASNPKMRMMLVMLLLHHDSNNNSEDKEKKSFQLYMPIFTILLCCYDYDREAIKNTFYWLQTAPISHSI